MTNKHYVQNFHFDRQKPCYCGSGIPFGHCCATTSSENKRPKYINVINNFISANDCKRFVRYAEKQKREWLMVVDDQTKNGGKRELKRHPNRVTQQVSLNGKKEIASNWMDTACKTFLTDKGPLEAQWYEKPQLLRYGPGGKYDAHADADHLCQNTKKFYRFIDRDFSMLIYLNDDYEGGGLFFPGLEYHYQPVAGDLVIFPSNHIFTHASLPIVSGKKYALVSWGAFKGSPRVAMPRGAMTLSA